LATNKIGKDAVSKSSFAMIVLAAISTSLLLMPDSATHERAEFPVVLMARLAVALVARSFDPGMAAAVI